MGAAVQRVSPCSCVSHLWTDVQKPSASQASLSKAEERRVNKLARKEQQRAEYGIKKRDKKREQRQRRQGARQEMLAAMTDDERNQFIKREKAEQQARQEAEQASLRYAYEQGAPKVVVNCSFADAMDRKELTSLAKQLQLSYTAVRDLRSPIQLHFTSLHEGNPGLHSLEKIGFKKWLVHIHEKPVWEVFDLSKLVILSPDAEEDLDEVLEDSVYVIGGLVDRTIKRNQTLAQAGEIGAPMLRRLPIKSFGPLGMYPVLNIDVVVTILHERFKKGPTSDWREILLQCMPQRQQPGPSRRALRKQRKTERKSASCSAGVAREGSSPVCEDGAPGEADVDDAEDDDDSCSGGSSEQESDGERVQREVYRQGTVVEVGTFGRAKIISLGLLPQGKHQGKYKVRYIDDGSMYHVFPEQVTRVIDS